MLVKLKEEKKENFSIFTLYRDGVEVLKTKEIDMGNIFDIIFANPYTSEDKSNKSNIHFYRTESNGFFEYFYFFGVKIGKIIKEVKIFQLMPNKKINAKNFQENINYFLNKIKKETETKKTLTVEFFLDENIF